MTKQALRFLHNEIKNNKFIDNEINIENNIATIIAFKNTMAIKFTTCPANMEHGQLERFLQARNIEGFNQRCKCIKNTLIFSNGMEYKMLPFKQTYKDEEPIDFKPHAYYMIKVDNLDLLDALKRASAILDTVDLYEEDGASVALNVYFEIDDDELNIITTNGRVISKCTTEVHGTVKNEAKYRVFSVSAEHIKFISKMANITSKGNTYTNIYISHNMIDFSFGSLRFIVPNNNDINRIEHIKNLMFNPVHVFNDKLKQIEDTTINNMSINTYSLRNIINKISLMTQSTHTESCLFNFVNFKNGIITGYHLKQDIISIKNDYYAENSHDLNVDIAVMQAIMQNIYFNYANKFNIKVGTFKQKDENYNIIYMKPAKRWEVITVCYKF